MSELSTGAGCGGGPTGAPELWKEVTWGQNVGHGEDLEDVELLNFELEGFDKHET
jgi:hypothetical protein